jgi:predicted ABC-type exoprotein transport system permease subunit
MEKKMKQKNVKKEIIKFIITIMILIILGWVIAPMLVSAKSTALVLLGITLTVSVVVFSIFKIIGLIEKIKIKGDKND